MKEKIRENKKGNDDENAKSNQELNRGDSVPRRTSH